MSLNNTKSCQSWRRISLFTISIPTERYIYSNRFTKNDRTLGEPFVVLQIFYFNHYKWKLCALNCRVQFFLSSVLSMTLLVGTWWCPIYVETQANMRYLFINHIETTLSLSWIHLHFLHFKVFISMKFFSLFDLSIFSFSTNGSKSSEIHTYSVFKAAFHQSFSFQISSYE